MLTVAAAAALTAVGLTNSWRISEAVLWTVSGASLVLAAVCFIAHWDVNRGRKIKRSIVEEEPEYLPISGGGR
jgi:hypothetical protein